ncbi:hypothetical protein M0R04_04465 [Candidatus Dojkabacteria bacterium]|nr:hypothetical protein [Candidatus Dojkabacteria bacterium]
MQLTEQQIADRDELFFTIINEFVEDNYEIDDDYVMTEEDAYITSIVMDYFEENFKYPTLMESVLEDITGYDINEDLYKELTEILLDESIGTFVAGAAHGIRNAVSAYKSSSASKNKLKTVTKDIVAQKRLKDFKGTPKPSVTPGAVGAGKAEFIAQKGAAIQKRAEKARATRVSAETKRKSLVGKHQSNKAKTGQLADKIDTGIKNVKNRVKSAITTGAQRIGGFMGRVAGHLAT